MQDGCGKISNHMRNIEQAGLLHQRRYGNPWMVNGYAARLIDSYGQTLMMNDVIVAILRKNDSLVYM